MAAQISLNSGGPGRVGEKRVGRFLSRHGDLTTKVDGKTESERISHTNAKDLATWFKFFQRVKCAHNVKPANIWNMDETSTALGIWQINMSSEL
jgi:hypothetical protein